MCEKDDIFDISFEGRTSVPIQFKILAALRILARGNCYDDISEMSQIPNSSIPYYFLGFCKRFSELYYNDYIKFPADASLAERMAHYAALGIPGGMGSLDCTHVHWDKCPKWMKNLCVGKEGSPPLRFWWYLTTIATYCTYLLWLILVPLTIKTSHVLIPISSTLCLVNIANIAKNDELFFDYGKHFNFVSI